MSTYYFDMPDVVGLFGGENVPSDVPVATIVRDVVPAIPIEDLAAGAVESIDWNGLTRRASAAVPGAVDDLFTNVIEPGADQAVNKALTAFALLGGLAIAGYGWYALRS